jgi:hypothetical protein
VIAPNAWADVTGVLIKHYCKPDIQAARVLCSTLASHVLKQHPPLWCMAIAPPGSMKTDLLESFRGLPRVHFVDEVTPNTFLSGKLDDQGKQRRTAASLLHRIGSDASLVAADFSTFTSNPKTLGPIMSQLRRIYDGHFTREFGTDENLHERTWAGRLTFFAGAVPDIDRHYSVFQGLGERFVRGRWPRSGGIETGLRAMHHDARVAPELREVMHSLMYPIFSPGPIAATIPRALQVKISTLSELVALARTHIHRDSYSREAVGEPVTESNTRLPQQLCQLARGSALLDGRSDVNEEDYSVVWRVAFDSVPSVRTAILMAIQSGQSTYSLGLPKATVERATEDLTLAGVLTDLGDLSENARKLLAEARFDVK